MRRFLMKLVNSHKPTAQKTLVGLKDNYSILLMCYGCRTLKYLPDDDLVLWKELCPSKWTCSGELCD